MEGRTSIVIAHRLSTIVRADSILLVDAGKIVAQGTHEELYKTREEYRKMVDLHGSGESKGTE
jgi:ABC-type multidrug transport system fused ATPase/permease subunit